MYEGIKKDTLRGKPRVARSHLVRTPAARQPQRTLPVTAGGEGEQQIVEMERTFTDRWEW
jgi:hypothetical protein